MKITVAIASYKYGHLAAHAIESVLAQSRMPDEIILSDDGAGDCGHLINLYPDVRIVVQGQNLGMVKHFNQLLEEATSDRMLIMGADNALHPRAIERMASIDLDIVGSHLAFFGSDAEAFKGLTGATEEQLGHIIWRFQRGDIEIGNFLHGSSLFNRQKAIDAGGFFANPNSALRGKTESDWMLWRAMIRRGATYGIVDEPLLYYRRHRYNFQGV